jgi:hypothetical protein
MLASSLERVRSRPFLSAAVGICLLAGIAFGSQQVVGWLEWRTFAAQVASVDGGPEVELDPVSWSFFFRDATCTVTAWVDPGELERAAAIDTEAVFGSTGWLRAAYASHLIRAQSESAFIDRLAGEFRRLGRWHGLDQDEYVELLAAAVQSIPYGTVGPRVRLPAETLSEGDGVCTDRSTLLGALLLHEGYDTVLWVFDSQRHAALGVACDGDGFRGSGYAFIETTKPAYVGQAEARYRSSGPTHRPPHMIALGGERAYGATNQVELILARLDEARKSRSRLRSYVSDLDGTTGALRERYEARVEEHEEATRLVQFITDNPHDRENVFVRIYSPDGGQTARSL